MSQEIQKVFLKQTALSKTPEEFIAQAMKFQEIMMMYSGAMREVRTKLEVLNDEFQIRSLRNPIEYIKCRLKTPSSIIEKLERKGLESSLESMLDNINDIAGVRVICPFIDDIYTITDMLIKQDDITLIELKDYIKSPKANGYRSIHLVVEVPVYFSDRVRPMRVEIQIRTVAMDFWASVEHQIHYKNSHSVPDNIINELRECAEIISSTDLKMQDIQKQLSSYINQNS
jgi:putative GTP pyrophosphokinase